MEYVEKLKGKGDLPGFADSELGDFSMDAGKIILGVGVTYPLTVTISASKTAKNVSWYCYELSKQNSNEEWRLVNAWQDKEGQWISLPRTPVGKFRSQQLTNEMTR